MSGGGGGGDGYALVRNVPLLFLLSNPQSHSVIASRVQYNHVVRDYRVSGLGDPLGNRWTLR